MRMRTNTKATQQPPLLQSCKRYPGRSDWRLVCRAQCRSPCSVPRLKNHCNCATTAHNREASTHWRNPSRSTRTKRRPSPSTSKIWLTTLLFRPRIKLLYRPRIKRIWRIFYFPIASKMQSNLTNCCAQQNSSHSMVACNALWNACNQHKFVKFEKFVVK